MLFITLPVKMSCWPRK